MPVALSPINQQRQIVAKIEELFSDLDTGVAAPERAQANLKRYRAAVLKAAVEGRLTAEWRKAHTDVEPASKLLERILAERHRKWEEAQLARFAAVGRPPPKGWKDKYPEPAKPDTASLPNLPEGWCWATVDQTSEVQGGIQKQPKRIPRNNPYPYLRVANVQKVSELPLPLPPIVEQVAIVDEVEIRLTAIDHAERELGESLVRASRLRQSILKRAFEGKLVPQDPNDEPASVLLERVRAARAAGSSVRREIRSSHGSVGRNDPRALRRWLNDSDGG